MAEGLEVVIQYRGAKYNQVASPATASAEFAILKKDLAHLRVHSPSQKNVRRVDGSFILQWPTAGTASPKVEGLTDSLHTRWFKLCSDDPEALKLREFLSIQSIRLTQNGVLICSTAGAAQASQDAPPGPLTERVSDTAPQQAAPAALPTFPLPAKPPPPPPPPPPPKRPPSGPRFDRQQPPHLKRRLSDVGSSSSAVTRQKMDTPETQVTNPPRPTNTSPALPNRPRSTEDRQGESSASGDARKASPQTTREDETTTGTLISPQPIPPPEAQPAHRSPMREPGEMTPQRIHSGSTPNSSSGWNPARQPPRHPRTTSPYPDATSPAKPDVSGLLRELWDTRRQLTAMQAREQVVLDELERLGIRPGGSDPRSDRVTRDDVLRLEVELKAERDKRVRAERTLTEVERECRAPFVVPALFQAFMRISELSN